MAFHAYTKPTDYVTCHHTARQGIYEDAALTSGAVRIDFGYSGGPLADTFSRADDASSIGLYIEVGGHDLGTGGGDTYRWNQFAYGTWGVVSGKAYNPSGDLGLGVVWMHNRNTFAGIDGRFDADLSCDVTPTVKAGIARAIDPPARYLYAALTVGVGLSVVDVGGGGGTLLTVAMTVTSGVTYTIRMVNVGSNYTVYVDGVSKGTFTDTYFSAVAIQPALYANGDSGARFANFRLAKASNPVATTYTVRNYAGTVIKTGSVTTDHLDIADSDLTVDGTAGHKYGWYRLYLTGTTHGDGQWGTAYGDCTFIRIPTYSGVPANAGRSTSNLVLDTDEISRGVMALGINRYSITNSATAAATSIAAMTPAVTRMKTWWVDNGNATRPRRTFMSFPNGTVGNETNIGSIVTGLKTWVKVWGARNEPEATSPVSYVTNELTPFYAAVKAADSTAVVIAPGTVSFNASTIGWFHEFLLAGGDAYCDGYQLHPYNCYNGDLPGMRRTIGALVAEIAANGNPAKDIYQTEQGFGHAFIGIYTPHLAARWTALMVFCQEVLTMGRMRSENSYYWYDLEHGFDDFPFMWLTPAGPGPQANAIRTMAGETRDKTITSELDFGTTGNQMHCGGVWTNGSTGDKVIGVIGASVGLNAIRFAVTGATTFTHVDSWGNQTTLTASGGYLTFAVSELGGWLRVPSGTTAALAPTDWSWGINACAAGTPHTNSATLNSTYYNLAAMHDGVYENWYITNNQPVTINLTGNPFVDISDSYPELAWITFASQSVNRIVLFCMPPWHDLGTITDFDLQTYDGSTWTTRQTWTMADAKSFAFAGVDRCKYETFWDDQWIFEHKAVSPITCQGVRVNVRANSFGGFANKTISDIDNGQSGWGYWLMIREFQAFNVTGASAVQSHVRRWRRG